MSERPAGLETLPKGHEFPAIPFGLQSEWVTEYVQAVEDQAIASLGQGLVPPMAIAALSLRALLQNARLPAGAIHLGQELAFRAAVRTGERLVARARIASRGERGGWALLGVDLSLEDAAGQPVMTGRASVSFPLSAEV